MLVGESVWTKVLSKVLCLRASSLREILNRLLLCNARGVYNACRGIVTDWLDTFWGSARRVSKVALRLRVLSLVREFPCTEDSELGPVSPPCSALGVSEKCCAVQRPAAALGSPSSHRNTAVGQGPRAGSSRLQLWGQTGPMSLQLLVGGG